MIKHILVPLDGSNALSGIAPAAISASCKPFSRRELIPFECAMILLSDRCGLSPQARTPEWNTFHGMLRLNCRPARVKTKSH